MNSWLTTNYNCEDYPIRRRAYNNIISVEVTTDVVTEPVSRTEIKTHLKEESTDNDTYLDYLAKAAREQIEGENNVSLAPKTLKVKFRNDLGNVTLPYGPITEITEVTNIDGTVVDSGTYLIEGGSVRTSFYSEAFVEYETGYETIPNSYKQMILERIAFLFNHRGDEKKIKGGSWLL